MSVSSQEVIHVASLARISLAAGDGERYAQELTSILGYVERLRAVDTSQVEDGALFSEALAPDTDLPRTDADERERLIQAFPDRIGDFLRVPSVFPRRASTVS